MVDHLAISVAFVLYLFLKSLISHCFPFVTVWKCYSMFTAFNVGELGNKSIKACPSSKDCVRLGSSGIEPTRRRKLFFQDMKARYS